MHSPVVLALDFGGSKVAAAVCEASGIRLGTSTIAIRPEETARATFERALTDAQRLVEAVAPARPLLAVGASTFGIPGDDGIQLAPTIPGWGELVLGRELRRAFPGAEIRLATDVKAAAMAEAEWGALAGCDPGIYLNLGTGLAAAIVANGTVLAGRHGAAGEIGYNLRRIDDVGLALADRVPLEASVSGKALLREASAVLPGADGAAVFAAVTTDPELARLVAGFVAELSFHVVNLAIAVDPVRIVVGGGMVRAWAHLRDGLRAALDAAVPFPPELQLAHFPFDAPLVGAIALACTAAIEVRNQEASA